MQPTISLVKEMMHLFVAFITEREKVRIKKDVEKLPQPWTNDPIIADWRFCNINRCHDRETVWIFKNIIEAHKDSDSLWFNLVIARFINWRETLAHLGYFETWDADEFKKTILERQEKGLKVYTGAYLIPSGDAGVLRHDFIADEILTPLWNARGSAPKYGDDCEDWSVFLRQVKGMGDFMRNQIITDLKYTRYLQPFCSDWKTFCLAGPGTMRGLNRITGKSLNGKWKPAESNKALQDIRKIIDEESAGWCDLMEPYSAGKLVACLDDLNNLSNCFCEFDKYVRVKNGEGKPRSRYVRTTL